MTEPLTPAERRVVDASRHERAYRGSCRDSTITLMDPVARFWSKVDRADGPDTCWPWTGGRSYMGYGLFYVSATKRLTASRHALELTLGRVLRPRLMALHTCDNPPCCNPAHLYEGTFVDNRRDAVMRMRGLR